MLTKNDVEEMFSKIYFGSVDVGNMKKAVSILHDDVHWVHTQVWEHDKYLRKFGSDQLNGKEEVAAFLEKRKESLKALQIRHIVDEILYDGEKGAFIGRVEDPSGKCLPLFAWFETKDDKISKYIVGPLYIT